LSCFQTKNQLSSFSCTHSEREEEAETTTHKAKCNIHKHLNSSEIQDIHQPQERSLLIERVLKGRGRKTLQIGLEVININLKRNARKFNKTKFATSSSLPCLYLWILLSFLDYTYTHWSMSLLSPRLQCLSFSLPFH